METDANATSKGMLENKPDDSETLEQCTNDPEETVAGITDFKKPTVSIGPKRSRTVRTISKGSSQTDAGAPEYNDDCSDRDTKSLAHTQDSSFPYTEPPWSGKPVESYTMEVLKSGVIVNVISLNERSFHVIGRLPSCHVSLAHPTVSRYHAVLQYRCQEDKDKGEQKGLYVYDLGSTHGTFWNGNRIRPNTYVRVRGGHMLRFGCSQRKYILQAPPDDHEEESRYSVTELKEIRTAELEKRRTDVDEQLSPTGGKEDGDNGIDWGMREDADEETDLQENPYASITDEDLVLEDPKKTLRGWFEREGYDLHYQTEEKGIGQFLCWVDLPMEDIVGRSVRAEALVKGKKKEAVVQCALEACKILDKYGLLRQANHEARKRKTRNWEAEDYYDSDEDNFLDRTGSVEKKREQRMRLAGKLEEKVETYDTLLKKHEEVTKRISRLAASIENWQTANLLKNKPSDEDALDAFMSSLSSFGLTKSDITKMRLELQNLRKEEAGLIKLLNLTRPANLPALSCRESTDRPRSKHETVSDSSAVPSPHTKKIPGSMRRRGKERQATRPEKGASTITETVMQVGAGEGNEEEEEEEEEELDSENDNDSIPKSSGNDDAEQPCPISRVAVNECSTSDDVNEREQNKPTKTKKRREMRQKVCSDESVYSDNYSTWVPPQDQAGDGKTSLNEKYGY